MKAYFDNDRLMLEPADNEEAEFLLALWVVLNGGSHSHNLVVVPEKIAASGAITLRQETRE
jgi:hypothetical protein